MSQRNRNRSHARNLNTSSQSQSSRRGTQVASSPLSPLSESSDEENSRENYTENVVASVKFILNHISTKIPIKRSDIVKDCCNGTSKIFTAILSTVQNHLKSVYGIIFQEVTVSKGSTKQYICFATDNPSISLLKLKKADRREQTLLLLILSYMFVKGAAIGEGVLWNFLGRLDISIDAEHEYFGDVKKCFENFRKQLYIKRDRKEVETSNEEKITMEWGERASIEFDKKGMLMEIAQVFHKPTLFFKKQHMELMEEAERMEVDEE